MIGKETSKFLDSLNLVSGDDMMKEYIDYLPDFHLIRNKDLGKLRPGTIYIKHAPINETGVEMKRHIRKGGVLVAIGNMNTGKFSSVNPGEDYKYMMLKFSPSFNGEVSNKNFERFLRKQMKTENCFYYIKCEDHHLFAKNLKFSSENIREIMLKLITKYQE